MTKPPDASVLPAIVWTCDAEGRCVSLGKAWTVFTGASIASGLDWGFLNHIHPDDRSAVIAAFQTARDTGDTYQVEYRLRARDGTYRWVLDTAMPETKDGEFRGLTGAIIDNMARRASEEMLRERERELRLVTDAVPVLISHVDRNGRYRFANAAYGDWYGTDPETIVGKSVEELLGPERYQERANFIHAALGGQRVTYDSQVTLRDEQVRDVETTYVPNVCTSGNADGFIAVVNDITDRKKSLAQMQLMVGELKHHTANLLTMVQALARRSLKAEVQSPEAFRNFEGQLFALAAVSDAIAPRDFRQVAMTGLVERITAPHRESRRDQFEIYGQPLLLPSKFGIALAMALHELCTNATKYGALSRPEGEVRIEWASLEEAFTFRWEERGGPLVTVPERLGFGTTLLNRAFPEGKVNLDYRPEGLVFEVSAPIGG
jgi:PAS domain S-box-containing protein